jgi:transcriptional regulator with XRE-family HTH domain
MRRNSRAGVGVSKDKRFGLRVQQRRIELGLSVAELARQAEMKRQLIQQIERRVSNPHISTVLKLCSPLGFESLDEFADVMLSE